MESRPYNLVVFALYQLSVLVGICLLPVALLAKRVGVSLPVDRVIRRLDAAYEAANTN